MTDEEILAARIEARDKREGPRIGDYVLMPGEEEPRRFTYDWGDSIQTTHAKFRDASFYLGSNGGMDFSGSLDHALPKTQLVDTGETRLGRVWFFHENWVKAHNGVHFSIPCRVFKFIDDPVAEATQGRTIWDSDGTDGPVLICPPPKKKAKERP